MSHLPPEFKDYEAALLFEDEFPPLLRPKPLSPAEFNAEVQRYLKRGKPTKRMTVDAADVQQVQTNLRLLLERAEGVGGKDLVAEAYAAGSINQSSREAYRHDKHRYAGQNRIGPLELNPRLRLARAACEILCVHDPKLNEVTEIRAILGDTAVRYVAYNAESDALLDSGSMVSDAWRQVAQALDDELGLSDWFSSFPEVVENSSNVIAELLGIATSASIPSLPGDHPAIEDFEISDRLMAPEEASPEEYNFARHPHDEALAPSAALFKVSVARAKGRLAAGFAKGQASTSATICFWREVMLQLLPRHGGGILPCLTLVPKVTLNDAAGRPIALSTPFARPLGDRCDVPLILASSSGVHFFRPDDAGPFEGHMGLVGSISTVYQTAWAASSGATAILLRMMADETDRPIDRAVADCASRNAGYPTQFALGTIGNFVERASFATSRADGIGGLLRRDFYRRDAILRKHGIVVDANPHPLRFQRSWYCRADAN